MATSGPNNGATGASSSAVGTVDWTTPANALTQNDTNTTAALNNSTSYYLLVSNFSFAIPTNAVITGILVEIEKLRSSGTGTLADNRVHLIRLGTVMSSADNKAVSTAWATSDTDAYVSYGGDGDLWGIPWLAAEINSYDFGVAFSAKETASAAATAAVDHIRVTVYYTAGYLASPSVQESGEVFLFGQRYRLMPEEDGKPGQVRTTLASVYPQKVVTNRDYDRSSSPYHSSFSVDDLRGGMGHWKYRWDDEGRLLNGDCFWTSQNMDTLWEKAITLGPKMTVVADPGGGGFNGAMNLAGTIATLWGAVIFTWNGSSFSAAIDTLPGVAWGKQVLFNGRIFYPLGNNGYSYQSAAGSAATDVAAIAAVSMVVWDNKLYALDTASILYVSTTGDAGSWTTLAAIKAAENTTSYVGRHLITWFNASGDLTIYCVSAWGIFAYDAENDLWITSQLTYPLQYPYHAWKIMAGRYQSSLFVSTSLRGILKLTQGQELAVEDLTVGQRGLPAEFRLEIADWAQDNQHLFILLTSDILDIAENSTEGELLLVWNGKGFHPIRFRSETAGSAQRKIDIINISTFNRLVYAVRTTASANAMEWMDLNLFHQHPLFSTTKTYTAAGQVEFPYWDANYPEEIKTSQECHLKLLGASATETVQVAYRIDGSTGSYTNLGSAVIVNEHVVLPFGTGNVGLEFRSIQFKLTFASSGSTSAPKMEYFAMDCVRNGEVLRGYTLNLDLRTGAFGKTPQQMIDHIYAHLSAKLFGTFSYADDQGNVRSVTVKVLKPDLIESTGFDHGGVCQLQLIEMGSN